MLKKTLVGYVHSKRRIGIVPVIAALQCIITWVIFLSGGTATSFTNLMYIPIILSAFYFDIKGAVSAALLGGLLLGPWMPISVSEDIMQKPSNWLFRIVMFLVIGIVTTVLFENVKKFREGEIKQFFHNMATGLPNMNRLKLDLAEMLDKKAEFSLIGFRITNSDDVNRFAGYEIEIKAIIKAIELLSDSVDSPVYSISTNEFAVIIPVGRNRDPYSIGRKFLNQLKEPLSIDRFRIGLIVKGGIVNSSSKNEKPEELLKAMNMALGQETNGAGFVVYDSIIERENQNKYELMVSLFDAIKNNEFHIVYQPQMSLADRGVAGVEALLRWDQRLRGPIGPEIFIKTAEEIGLISEITKWVIKNVIEQIKAWQNEGMSIKVAINISQKDLGNNDVIDYLKKSIEENNLTPAMIELELTERSAMKNEKLIGESLHNLSEYGIKIALDDFETGYNSLVDFIKIPVDYLKIDKIFIDNITADAEKTIVKSVIDFAHRSGRKVIAEGVEMKEQLDILKNMGCDYIQGYYFSKPLLPEKIKELCLADIPPN